MEGLIPMFYRAMKKNRIRSQYSVLSPEAAAASSSSSSSSSSYNIADFFVDPPSTHVFPNSHSHYPADDPRRRAMSHRRFNSFGGSTAEDWRRTAGKSGKGPPQPQPQPQLVRFRSQRILSCLTGQ